jgi:tight adherence protein B
VFLVGKRSGGNLVGLMKNTIRMLQERMEAIEELYTILADKQLEFYLMSVIPMVMIMYLRIGAGPMIKSLYGNLTGILTMSVCLVIYGGSYLYRKKILEIDG